MVLGRYGQERRRIAVINCRADRADRSRQLAEAAQTWTPADHYVVVGTGTQVFAQRAHTLGMSENRYTCIERVPTGRLIRQLEQIAGESALVMGMGNIAGPGLKLVQHYRQQHQAAETRRKVHGAEVAPVLLRKAA